MADNIGQTSREGEVAIAFDDLGSGVRVPRVKAGFGADGFFTDVSNTNPLPITTKSSTAALANSAQAATSVAVLASNTNRKGALIYNDGTDAAFVKFGTGASTTSFTAKVAGGATYEVPFGYTGVIEATWAAAGTGVIRSTELA